ncbi:hypothetical protein [uncultured Brachyspira sp.]|uniref:hypothetical protein n=1 Tax=uncultured Brachyspira sp. TaxID=221953 RepID=UPI00262A3F7C|nr:hypothetical protein [uncultured Brachyspira sp.]
MNENRNQKIIKTILSLTISFLIIFIVAMFARAASDTILPQNSAASLFINDYLDMMKQRIDKIAVGMKIKRNSVSQYQVNLITQSISDYVGYNMYQTSDTLKNYDPNKSPTKAQLDKYKNDYYRMTVENPYLKGMTVFDMNGKMMLNLYLSRNKSWPLELQNNLINEIKQKGSLVLNASNENAFYIMEYIKNNNGEMIVTTRNDYSYVSDIAMYYQVADKSLFVSDSRNSVYNVKEPIGNNLEKVSSVINRYAYYKKQPSFVVNDSLTVSMITKEYPNYFELIVLAITALLILTCQLVIKGIIAFFKYLMQIKTNRDYVKNVQGDDELINESIVNTTLPVSNTHEEMPPMIQKVHYNIPNEYLKEKKENEKNDEFNIGRDILNIVANIKEEINNCRNKFSITKDDLKKEEKIEIQNEEIKEENKAEMQNEDLNTVNILEENKIEEVLLEEDKAEIQEELNTVSILEEVENEVDDELSNKEEELTISEYEENKYDYDKYAPSYYDKEDEEKEIENMFINVSEELKNNADEKESIVIENISEENEKEISNYETNNSDYRKINEEDIFNKKIVKENLLSSHKEKEEEKNKEYARSLFNKKTDSYIKSDSNNAAKDILNSYNKAVESMDLKPKEETSDNLEKTSNSRTDDVFAAFDKMLSSIISKAEKDARNSITKK